MNKKDPQTPSELLTYLGLDKHRLIAPEEMPEIHRELARRCATVNLKMPPVYEIESDVEEAYYIGLNGHRAIAYTTGLRKLYNDRQFIEAMTHELAHLDDIGDIEISSMSRRKFLATTAMSTALGGLIGYKAAPEKNIIPAMKPFIKMSLGMAGTAIGGSMPYMVSLSSVALEKHKREKNADCGTILRMGGDPDVYISALDKLAAARKVRLKNDIFAQIDHWIIYGSDEGRKQRVIDAALERDATDAIGR